jgi:glycosyltransferase involved in cell wall biosynthesis
MRALGGGDWRLWAGRYRNELLDAALQEPAFAGHVLNASPRRRGGRFIGALQNEAGFAAAMRANGAGLVHRTYYPLFDLLPRRKLRIVETLHDMWDERSDGQLAMNGLKSRIKRRALAHADAIVCVSDSSRREMLSLWPDLAPRTHVIHHGVRPLSAQPRPAGRDRPFFLFVGRRGSYKNLPVALAGLAAAALRDHDLVCFGGGAFTAAEHAAISAAGLAGRVHQLGGNDDRLAGLYTAATALLYPSAYEGFGLPLLEAMIHDCPVIAAPLTSLPEVGGGAALYADPATPDAWGAAMARLAGEPDLATTLRRAGQARAAGFSWAHTAAAHAALYAELS